jgi:hypothetical protein
MSDLLGSILGCGAGVRSGWPKGVVPSYEDGGFESDSLQRRVSCEPEDDIGAFALRDSIVLRHVGRVANFTAVFLAQNAGTLGDRKPGLRVDPPRQEVGDPAVRVRVARRTDIRPDAAGRAVAADHVEELSIGPKS